MLENQNFEAELKTLEDALKNLGAIKGPVGFDFLIIDKAARLPTLPQNKQSHQSSQQQSQQSSHQQNHHSSIKMMDLLSSVHKFEPRQEKPPTLKSQVSNSKIQASQAEQFFGIRQMNQK
jgi:hypothetical protein